MSYQVHKDLSYSTIPVGGAPSPSTTGASLKVASAADRALFPTPPFMATVWPPGISPTAANAEIVQINGTTGTDGFVMARAQEGSTAQAIVAGYQIAATVTIRPFTDLENAVNQKTFVTVSPNAGADYVTGGVFDNIQIQAAINAVSASGGGTVFLKAGTYTINATINLASNVNIIGEGYSSKIVESNGFTLKISGKNNIRISNIHLDANLMFAGNFYGLYAENCQNLTIDHCYIENASGFGIFVTGNTGTVENIWITDNYVQGKGNADVIGGGPAFTTCVVQNVFIQRNRVIQNYSLTSTQSGAQGAAINFVAATNYHFDNNITQGDILFGSEAAPHTYSTISGNIVAKPIGGVRGALGLICASTTQGGGSGIVISGNTINGGFIDCSNSHTAASGLTVVNTIISNNSINAAGVSTAKSEAGIVTNHLDGLVISGNVIFGSTGDGIWLSNTINTVVSGNLVRGSAGFGIKENTTDGTTGNNQYDGNMLINNFGGNTSTLSATDLLDDTSPVLSLTFTTSTSSTSTSSTSSSSTSSSTSTSSTSSSSSVSSTSSSTSVSSTSSSRSTSSTSSSISTSSTSTSTTVIAFS